MEVKNIKWREYTTFFLLLTYLTIRFFFTQKLDSFGNYASYIFEVALVSLMIVLSWQKFKGQWRLNKVLSIMAAAALVCGYGIFKMAGLMQIQIPFNLSGGETLIFLLIVAPILEELIFRFFSWEPLTKLGTLTAFVGTTILFSYSHLHSIWFVPDEIHKFIFYQTVYTLFLGLTCGFSVWKYRSLSGAILIHFGFNLGFYLGSII